MRRWLPLYIVLAVVLAAVLFSLQLVVAQTDSSTPPAGKTVQIQRSDTLAGLAARFNKPVACLQIANKRDLTDFSLTGLTTILIPDDCDKVLASIKPATPTPESAESLTTATFTPIATVTPKVSATPAITNTPSAFATFVTPIATAISDQVYTVVNGDRLSRIAAKFGLTVACIANANAIVNPDLIYPGQQLQISANCIGGSGGGVTTTVDTTRIPNPQACRFDRNSGRTAPGGAYTVQAGDSLDFIACDFNIDLQCLKDSNTGLDNTSVILPGDTLTINRSCPVWRDSSLPKTQ